jgi:hypothetical protein
LTPQADGDESDLLRQEQRPDGKFMGGTIMSVARLRTAIIFLALMLILPLVLAAQQPPQQPPGNPGAPMGTQPRPGKVFVSGENPAIRLLDKEGGTVLSMASFWRVNWSPVGFGHICYVTIGDEKAGGLRIALTDNEKVYNFITNDMFGKIAPEYKTRPFKVIKAVITTAKYTEKERVENCRSAEYNVDLVWGDLDAAAVFVDGQFADPTSPDTPFKVDWVRIPARSGQIIINGKESPGRVYPTGGGAVRGSTANVIFGEDWYQ